MEKPVDRWRQWAITGEIFQIRNRDILFSPLADTRTFWLYLDRSVRKTPLIGKCELVLTPEIFNCKRLIVRRGETIQAPLLDIQDDHLKLVRGYLQQLPDNQGAFILDAGFPMVVKPLDPCHELDRAQLGEVLEIEPAPPIGAYLV
jgi:hypothetical protein